MCANERGRPAGAASDDEHHGDGDVESIVRRELDRVAALMRRSLVELCRRLALEVA
jgi:hypothetical protein